MNFHSKSIIALLLVIISFVLGYFAVLPRWSSYLLAKDELATEKQTQQELEKAQKEMNNFLADYKSHSQEAAQLNNALPLTQSQVYNVLKNLEDIGKSSGLTLGALNVIESPNSDQLGASENSIQTIEINLTVNGNSDGFRNFLTLLESNLRIIDVQSVQMLNDNTGIDIKHQIRFKTYYQK
jgi:Tfp pilus assembly protein PilO